MKGGFIMSMISTTINPAYSFTYDVFDSFFVFGLIILVLFLAISVFYIMTFWKLFKKADEPGWAIFVPFYAQYVLFKIAFGNGWFFLLSLIPIVNIMTAVALPFMLAKSFGKDIGWGFGLLFLSFIFYPLLAFDSSYYMGNKDNVF